MALENQFEKLHAEYEGLFGAGTQKWAVIRAALAGIGEHLKFLKTHGIHLRLEKGEDLLPHQEWPKMYTNDQGEELVVASPEMAKNLTEGWRPTVAEEPGRRAEPLDVSAAETFTLGLSADGKPAVLSKKDEKKAADLAAKESADSSSKEPSK